MKFKQKTISIVLSILVLSCHQKKSKWQGTIEEVDGVTVIKNPVEPMYGAEIIEIEEDLAIREEPSDDGLKFEMLVMLCIDDDGNIYAVDMYAACIKVFDSLGNHKFNIGRKGQGPGEFTSPFRIQYITPDRIMILDVSNYRLSWFSCDGDLIREISTVTIRPSRVESDVSGNLVVRVSVRTEKGYGSEIRKLDANLKELYKVSSLIKKPTPAGTFPMQIPLIQFHVAPNEHIIWGNESRYEFNIVDEYGETVKKIINEYDPLEITEHGKKRLIEATFGSRGVFQGRKPTFPSNYLPFNNFLIDDKGRIIARTYKHTSEWVYLYDIFDNEGRFLVSIPLKKFAQAWKNNKLYFIETDKEGYQVIKRYRITWKL